MSPSGAQARGLRERKTEKRGGKQRKKREKSRNQHVHWVNICSDGGGGGGTAEERQPQQTKHLLPWSGTRSKTREPDRAIADSEGWRGSKATEREKVLACIKGGGTSKRVDLRQAGSGLGGWELFCSVERSRTEGSVERSRRKGGLAGSSGLTENREGEVGTC